ncbi:MAG: 16S rRNA (adenine(1518)-N(6)/adenine(1519)-N(6))-dimethyltransferase RsmA [Clostridia bacterium]|nr:16S rRNA (adenine(1518)-N(6)/adenine(1519)-N(6))-dimethyltransferase RsmA [Clostridia bacterium]
MANLSDISVIKDIMTRHGFSFSKALGQNFLVNPSVCPRMAEMCGIDENTGVIEVGPGIGVLTKELALRAKKVVSIELDERLPAVLKETLAEFDNVEIISGDVLKTDLHKLIAEKFQGMKVVVCANLPYYITSPVIMYLLENKLPIEALTVMIQKEVAERLCAEAGTRNAGAITVSVNYFGQARKLFDVSRGSFMPAPNVDSAVIKIDIKKEPTVYVSDEKKFFKMVKAAFSMRRKTALNAISAGMSIPKDEVAAAIEKSGLDLNIRAEKMNMEELALLCENL